MNCGCFSRAVFATSGQQLIEECAENLSSPGYRVPAGEAIR